LAREVDTCFLGKYQDVKVNKNKYNEETPKSPQKSADFHTHILPKCCIVETFLRKMKYFS